MKRKLKQYEIYKIETSRFTTKKGNKILKKILLDSIFFLIYNINEFGSNILKFIMCYVLVTYTCCIRESQ